MEAPQPWSLAALHRQYQQLRGYPLEFQNPWDPEAIDIAKHIAHLPDAVRITEDAGVRASLIYDESVLTPTRTTVVWVSANTFRRGSIYGNVSFDYDWSSLVRNKQFYWVEWAPQYNPPAFRILITDQPPPPSIIDICAQSEVRIEIAGAEVLGTPDT